MEEKKNILTYAGLQKLEEELQELKVNRRREVAEKIKTAKEMGDITENAEYDSAKEEQVEIEHRIEEIEAILKNVEVIDTDDVDTKRINVGCRVKVRDLDLDEEQVFCIVGSTEANSLQGMISNESPVGRALIGAKARETVTVDLPGGQVQYKILSIKKL